MKIENNLEFANSRELRKRFVSALEAGQLNLTGAEYEQWKPSLENKIFEIDRAAGDFLMQLGMGSVNTVSPVYVTCISSAAAITPTHSQITSNVAGSMNVLTGPSPESVAPKLPFK